MFNTDNIFVGIIVAVLTVSGTLMSGPEVALFTQILSEEGLSSRRAANGKEALARIAERVPMPSYWI